MDQLVPLAGALLAVTALIVLCARMGFAASPSLASPEEAGQLADSLCGGFRPVATVMDQGAKGALLADREGRVAVIAPIGSRFLARLVVPGWSVERLAGGSISLAGDDVAVRLDIGSAAEEWIARLGRAARLPGATAA